jgi:prepilin-type N-terminal cleavage/methylation domain-containing protein
MFLRVVPNSLPKQFGLAVTGRPAEGATLRAQAPAGLHASQQGGTLIETLIATVILGILGAGIIGSINYGMFMLRLARENARATQVLVEKSEALRMYNWYQLVYSNNFVPTNFTAAYDPQAPTNSQGVTYNGTITIGTVPFSASYSASIRQVTIAIQWATMGRVNHSRSLTTYVAKDGMQNYVY